MCNIYFVLGSKKDNDHVFFYAKMKRSDTALNTYSIVKFSTILNNEGNHFNSGDSVFVSPVSGVYLFSWTTMTYSGKNVNTELRVNNIIKETLHASLGSSVGSVSVSRTIICNVRKNDHVWIQTSGQFSENLFHYGYISGSSFMGFLMYRQLLVFIILSCYVKKSFGNKFTLKQCFGSKLDNGISLKRSRIFRKF